MLPFFLPWNMYEPAVTVLSWAPSSCRTTRAPTKLSDLQGKAIGVSDDFARFYVREQGRLRLPAAARAVLGATAGTSTTLRSVSGGVALVLRSDGVGGGVAVRGDGRGRVRLPFWLRHSAPDGLVVVGTHCDPAGVVVASMRVLIPASRAPATR
jgi:hypothetical protein